MTDSGDRATCRDAATRTAVRLFVGAIVVGVGLGILLGDFGAWLLIGVGAGFILMAFIAAKADAPRSGGQLAQRSICRS